MKITKQSCELSGQTRYYNACFEFNNKEVEVVLIYNYDSNSDSWNNSEWTYNSEDLDNKEIKEFEDYLNNFDCLSEVDGGYC